MAGTIRVIGVQSANAAAYPPLLVSRVTDDHEDEADHRGWNRGCATRHARISPSSKSTVDEVVPVSDDDIARALVMLSNDAKLVVEPAGRASASQQFSLRRLMRSARR